MEDKEIILKIRNFKEEHGYTLHELSRRLDIQVSTLERWLRTNRINRLYADFVKKKPLFLTWIIYWLINWLPKGRDFYFLKKKLSR